MIVWLILSFMQSAQAIGLEYSQRFSDEVMDQRLCFSIVAGTEYLKYTMSAAIRSYIRFFNDPLKFKYQRKGYKRFKQKNGEEPIGLVDIHIIERDEHDRGNVQLQPTQGGFEITLEYPLKFESDRDVKGTIDFGFKIGIDQNYDTKTKNGNNWKFDVSFSKKAEIINFKCSKNNCDKIMQYIESDLPSEIFTHG